MMEEIHRDEEGVEWTTSQYWALTFGIRYQNPNHRIVTNATTNNESTTNTNVPVPTTNNIGTTATTMTPTTDSISPIVEQRPESNTINTNNTSGLTEDSKIAPQVQDEQSSPSFLKFFDTTGIQDTPSIFRSIVSTMEAVIEKTISSPPESSEITNSTSSMNPSQDKSISDSTITTPSTSDPDNNVVSTRSDANDVTVCDAGVEWSRRQYKAVMKHDKTLLNEAPALLVQPSRIRSALNRIQLSTMFHRSAGSTPMESPVGLSLKKTFSHDSDESTADSISATSHESAADTTRQQRRRRHRTKYVLCFAFIIGIAIAVGIGMYIQQQQSNSHKLVSSAAEIAPERDDQPNYRIPTVPLPTSPVLHPARNGKNNSTLNSRPSVSQRRSRAPIIAIPTKLPTTGVPTVIPTTEFPTASPTPSTYQVNFLAIGDIPYNHTQAVILKHQMDDIANYYEDNNIEFLIHVGDFRKDSGDCELEEYQLAANLLKRSPIPVFVIPGDNDWTNCPNGYETGFDYWFQEFQNFEDHWNHDFKIRRHPDRPETFTFIHKTVLFIGLNIAGDYPVGSDQKKEWHHRLGQQVEWVKELINDYVEEKRGGYEAGRVVIFGHANPKKYQADFFDPFVEYINNELENDVPILYLNGDLHQWGVNPNFYGASSFLRIMVSGEAVDPPTLMSVYATGEWQDPEDAFEYDRRRDTYVAYYDDDYTDDNSD